GADLDLVVTELDADLGEVRAEDVVERRWCVPHEAEVEAVTEAGGIQQFTRTRQVLLGDWWDVVEVRPARRIPEVLRPDFATALEPYGEQIFVADSEVDGLDDARVVEGFLG